MDSSNPAIRFCFSKVRCRTESEAAHRAKAATKKFGRPTRYYYCGACCGFHLTTKPTMAEAIDAKAKKGVARG